MLLRGRAPRSTVAVLTYLPCSWGSHSSTGAYQRPKQRASAGSPFLCIEMKTCLVIGVRGRGRVRVRFRGWGRGRVWVEVGLGLGLRLGLGLAIEMKTCRNMPA